MRSGNCGPHEFTAEEIEDLLGELDERLKRHSLSASVFIVGGAAIAVNSRANPRRTEDVDAIMRRDVQDSLLAEAHVMASERGLPDDWLSPNARMWMPPLPGHVLRQHREPGLHITYADDAFLLATKLIAQRRKDAADIVELAERLGLNDPISGDFERLIRRHYTDEDELELILGVNDIDQEIGHLAESAARMLAKRRPEAPDPPTDVGPR